MDLVTRAGYIIKQRVLVSEPATLVLFGLGLAGLGLARRRTVH